MARVPDRYRPRILIALAWAFARSNHHEHARAFLAQLAHAELRAMLVLHGGLGTLTQLAETYYLLEDTTSAAPLYDQLAPHASCNAVGPALHYRGAVAHYLGLLALTLDQREREHLREAERINVLLGMPLQLARTRALLR